MLWGLLLISVLDAGVSSLGVPKGRLVNPISTRGTDYAHQITYCNTQIFRPSDGPVRCTSERRSANRLRISGFEGYLNPLEKKINEKI